MKIKVPVPLLGLSPKEEERLIQLVGPRYKEKEQLLKLVSDRFPNRIDNKVRAPWTDEIDDDLDHVV